MRATVIQLLLAASALVHAIGGNSELAAPYVAGALVIWALRTKKEDA